RQSHRYDEFVRVEIVRRINQFFPNGFGPSPKQEYGMAAGWAMWASLFEPSQENAAHAVWSKIHETMKTHLQWGPNSPDDPLLKAAFSGHSFEPSEDERRFRDAKAFMERTAYGFRPWSDRKSVEKLSRVPLGYGYLYGLYAIDGQVCNGGFIQYYQNTRGTPA